MKKTGFQVRGYCPREELEKIAGEKNISLTYNHHVKEEGWISTNQRVSYKYCRSVVMLMRMRLKSIWRNVRRSIYMKMVM